MRIINGERRESNRRVRVVKRKAAIRAALALFLSSKEREVKTAPVKRKRVRATMKLFLGGRKKMTRKKLSQRKKTKIILR